MATSLHFVGLSTQRRGSMDARQEAGAVCVCLVGSRRNLATDWRSTAALTLTVSDERVASVDEAKDGPRPTLERQKELE